jgi:hypothetical protein
MAPGNQAAAAAPGILSAVSLYHKLGQRAAAIVAGVADPSFKARLLTPGVEANPLTAKRLAGLDGRIARIALVVVML